MSMTDKVAQIAAKLTEAQRRYLTTEARQDFVWAEKRWMTYPPSNTHRVLHQLDLVLAVGMITDLGLAVRAHLERVQ